MTLDAAHAPKSWGKLSGHRWRTVRRQCFERDMAANAPCWICGGAINYAVKDGPDSWQPDHVLEADAHPEMVLDPTNIRASHARCNNRRGQAYKAAKKHAEDLGEPSEDWGL